mmetsp:Transcript_15007/g.34186  ORF Transcript_15007/g.34186 Transcript_15007/m.34186 type:complete len:110 (+) Transcript_15007:87-416(+)
MGDTSSNLKSVAQCACSQPSYEPSQHTSCSSCTLPATSPGHCDIVVGGTGRDPISNSARAVCAWLRPSLLAQRLITPFFRRNPLVPTSVTTRHDRPESMLTLKMNKACT